MSFRLINPAPSPFKFIRRIHFSSISELLSNTDWFLPSPSTQIHTVSVSPHLSFSKVLEGDGKESPVGSCFHVVRDDLLHPLANGNKSRKLDALLPILRQCSATDVVTCGGCQSAHTAALAVYCAELGIKPHLLLRGEQPKIPTGYNLVSLMFGNVTYNSRSVYAQRKEMLYNHAVRVAGANGSVMWADEIFGEDFDLREMEVSNDSRRVVIVNEGASSVLALLGVIRLVNFLSESPLFGNWCRVHIIVDAGTGTTAVGLALGIFLLGLPWKVTAVMLADKIESYKERENSLISEFEKAYQLDLPVPTSSYGLEEILSWVERSQPRKFGKVLDGEIERCRQIAQQTGILLDPIYTLAAWDETVSLSLDESKDTKVLMLHTGGTLGMFGLAQRHTSSFEFRKDTNMGL
ncbi:hypothetical protein LUZ60_011496 [Juncus effusus]|nr:hypothetical protein LUZ60_011496 [Juncus effusus]